MSIEKDRSGQDWMDKQRNQYVQEWAGHKLAREQFGKLSMSMGFVEPDRLLVWAKHHHVEQWLPQVYRSELVSFPTHPLFGKLPGEYKDIKYRE
jgi:hypothetical protein